MLKVNISVFKAGHIEEFYFSYPRCLTGSGSTSLFINFNYGNFFNFLTIKHISIQHG